jgi:uncharacterized protein
MSGSLHAWYSLRDLESLARREVTLSGELDLSKLTRLVGLLHSDLGSVRASLRFKERRDGWLALELATEASLQLVCQRCLEPFMHKMAERANVVLADAAAVPSEVPPGSEPFEVAEGRLQPAQLVEEELIVSMPLAPKHARIEDCGSLARSLAELVERSEPVDR